MAIIGGIEGGGTKFICVVGDSEGNIHQRQQIVTETPAITLPKVVEFFQQQAEPISALGIGMFGPLDKNPQSANYGCITSTPKTAWQHCNIVQYFQQHFSVPIGFDTDVNAAALGEYYWGNAQGLSDFVYLTVGTGIGGGGMSHGKLMQGAMHPEMGHCFVPQDKHADPFAGICPYHGNCLEGLAAGPAIKARWQVESAMVLPADHPAWLLEARYLAYAIANYCLILSPQRIILGGGVMKQQQLLPLVREQVLAILAGYLTNVQRIDELLVSPALGDNAGGCGALALGASVVIE